MRRHASFKHLLFTDYEKPTSFKLNQILDLVEDIQLSHGPYSISLYEQVSDTQFTIQIHEDLSEIGGIKDVSSIYYTYRQFTVYYETQETTSGDYACWRDVTFSGIGGRWIAELSSGGNIYNNSVDVSSIDTDCLKCVANIESGWNGR